MESLNASKQRKLKRRLQKREANSGMRRFCTYLESKRNAAEAIRLENVEESRTKRFFRWVFLELFFSLLRDAILAFLTK